MTPPEYIQLKAFARQDGALLSLLWTGSFCCYILGLGSPFYSMLAIALMVATPFFVMRRLRYFRDYGREGIISLMRGWAFVILMFFYAGLLFAVVQYAYFAFLDNGFLLETFTRMTSTPEAEQAIRQFGMGEQLSESLRQLGQMRPIDLSLNMLTTNIMLGIVLGLPIAAIMKKGENRK